MRLTTLNTSYDDSGRMREGEKKTKRKRTGQTHTYTRAFTSKSRINITTDVFFPTTGHTPIAAF